jgi:plasmid stability protein
LCVTLLYVVRNVTFSLPEDLVREAKILAATRDLSLNALVRAALEDAVKGRDRYRKAGERLLRKTKAGLYKIPPGSWNRSELHE